MILVQVIWKLIFKTKGSIKYVNWIKKILEFNYERINCKDKPFLLENVIIFEISDELNNINLLNLHYATDNYEKKARTKLILKVIIGYDNNI